MVLAPDFARLLYAQAALPSGAALVVGGVMGLLAPNLTIALWAAAVVASVGALAVEPHNPLLGLIPGALLGAVVAFATLRLAAVLVSVGIGALALTIGLLALASHTPYGALASRYPAAVGVLALLIAGLAITYQLLFEAASRRRAERDEAKLLRRELKADERARSVRFRFYVDKVKRAEARKKADAGARSPRSER
jgi:hypothetical protein